MTGRTERLLAAIAARVSAWLGERTEVRIHGGRFDLKELAAFSVHAPAALVTCVGTAAAKTFGRELITARLRMACFLLAKDKGIPGGRDSEARRMVDTVLAGVALENWAAAANGEIRFGRHGRKTALPALAGDARLCVGPDARSARAENLYSGTLRNKILALQAVTWEIDLDLPAPDPTAPPPVPLPAAMYRGIDPGTGKARLADYEKLAPEEAA